MSKLQPVVWTAGLIALTWIGRSLPATAQQPAPHADDEAEVRQAGQNYLVALDRGDAKAIAEFWTPEGTYTDGRSQNLKARELILKNFASGKHARPPVKVTANTVRFIAKDVALEEGACEMVPSGGTPGAGGSFWSWHSGWRTVHGIVGQTRWQMEAGKFAQSREEALPAETPQSSESLTSLEPLVGHWLGTSGNLTMQMSARWNSNKTFLHRELSIAAGGKPVFSGTQEIGRDPLTDTIQSWAFNSDGSRSVGAWGLDGNSWIVIAYGVAPDGKESSNTQIFKFPDKGTLVWKMIDASQAGQPLPNLEFTLRRQAGAK